MPDPSRFAAPVDAVMLAGGAARRMGGVCKAELEIGGVPLVARIAHRLGDAAALALAVNDTHLAAHGHPLIHDAPGFAEDGRRAGPLVGILAGMEWAAAHGGEWLLAVPCDAPFLPRDLLTRLREAQHRTGAAAVCAASNGRRHPATALWRVDLRTGLRRFLTEGGRKVGIWAEQAGAAHADWRCDPVDPFFNINTPDDLARASELARLHPDA